MSNYKQINAAANKKHLSSKQYEAYLALNIRRAIQVLDFAKIDLKKGKASRMSTHDIAGLEQKVIIAAEGLREADKLLQILPMSFGVWGKKVALACGS